MLRSLIKFLRVPNLIIVGLTQYLLAEFLLWRVFREEGVASLLDPLHFFLFVLDTVLITLSGNIVNDIVDVEIDKRNRPETVFVSQYISVKGAWGLYAFVVLLGLGLAIYLGLHIGQPLLILIYPGAVVMLFLYSKYFKRQALTGNITVALFCGGVAGIVLFAERHGFSLLSPLVQGEVAAAFATYAGFAYITTLFREVVKDIEDKDGDALNGCRTLPILLGEKVAKRIAFITGMGVLLFCIPLLYLLQFRPGAWAYIIFGSLGVVLPMIYNLYRLATANSKADYHMISTLTKGVMLAGLLFLPLYGWLG